MRLNEFNNTIAYHVTSADNVEPIMSVGLKPQIGHRTASANDPAGVYLFPSLEALEDAMYGWLGDQFPEDEELRVLEVSIPDGAKTTKGADYEIIITTPIPPSNITLTDIEL